MKIQLFCACLALALASVLACGKSGDPNTGTTGAQETSPGETTAPQETTPPPSKCQDAFDISAYDDSTYLSDSGSDVPPEELNCDFEDACCWNNDVSPRDELDFFTAEAADDAALEEIFGDNPPDGKFAAASTTEATGDQEAKFISCSIACTQEDVEVTLKHWTSANVELEVCTQDAREDNSPLLNCQPVDGDNGDSSTVTLPPGEFFRVVVVAKNFDSEDGCNAAAIDDIEVEATPCPQTTVAAATTTPAATTGNPDPCEEIGCDFEASSQCSYANLQQGGSNQWSTETEGIGNPDTGVPGPPPGSQRYQGIVVEPQETGVLQSEEFGGVGEPGQLRFKYYEATSGVRLKACINTLENCPFTSNTGIQTSDRDWLENSIPVDSNTQRIIFVCENTDQNFGSCGVDDIELTRNNQPVCP